VQFGEFDGEEFGAESARGVAAFDGGSLLMISR
jgi:hypothetical protein